jgi:ATP-binding cassette, subfamily C, bacterial CydCD
LARFRSDVTTAVPSTDVAEHGSLTRYRAFGVINAVIGVVGAILIAWGLSQIAHDRVARTVTALVLVLCARGAVTIITDEVVTRRQRTLRAVWQRRSVSQLAHSTPGELVALEVAIEHIGDAPGVAVLEASALTSFAALVPLFYFGGWLPLVIVLGLIVLSIPFYIRAGRSSELTAAEFQRRRSTLVARQIHLLRGVTDLRSLGAVPYGANEIAAISNAENRAVLDGVRVTIRSSLVTEFLGGVSVGLVAMVAGLRLWHDATSLYAALASVLVTAELFGWLRRYGSEFHRRDDAAAARRQLAHWRSAMTHAASDTLLETIDLKTGAPCQGVSVTLRTGSRVSISGPSGVGKSSFLDTALGLRSAVSGETARGATRVGLIRADNHFVDGTIRDNVALGATTSDDAIREIFHELNMDPRFDDVGAEILEDARSLSTGERVQLALARALLHNVELLVLDDVVGVLDSTARAAVTSTLARRPDLAVIEAGHDQSLLDCRDHVIELRATP